MKNSLTKLIYHSFVCKWYKMKTFRGGVDLDPFLLHRLQKAQR